MHHRILIPSAFLLFALTGGYCYDAAGYAGPKYPFQDPTLPWDVRVNDVISRLTLEELVNLSMIMGHRTNEGIPRLGIPAYTFYGECLRGYKGHNATAFPQALGLAATFRSVCLGFVKSEFYLFFNPCTTSYTIHID